MVWEDWYWLYNNHEEILFRYDTVRYDGPMSIPAVKKVCAFYYDDSLRWLTKMTHWWRIAIWWSLRIILPNGSYPSENDKSKEKNSKKLHNSPCCTDQWNYIISFSSAEKGKDYKSHSTKYLWTLLMIK